MRSPASRLAASTAFSCATRAVTRFAIASCPAAERSVRRDLSAARAPVSMQQMGFEWLHRLIQEPRRLAGRYARTNGAFVRLVFAELATRHRRSRDGRP